MDANIIQLRYPWDQQQHHHEGCLNPWCRHQHDEEWLEFALDEENLQHFILERCPLRAECPEPENCHFFHPMWEIQYNHPQTFARYLSLPYNQYKKLTVECSYLYERLTKIGLADWKESAHLNSIVPKVFKLFGGDVLAVADAVTVAVAAVAGEGIATISITGAREAVRAAVGDARALQMEEVITGICGVLEPELLALPPQQGITGKMMQAMTVGATTLSGGETVEASVVAGLAAVGVH